MSRRMNTFEIKSGGFYLNGNLLESVEGYSISEGKEMGHATLDLKIIISNDFDLVAVGNVNEAVEDKPVIGFQKCEVENETE